MLIYYVIFGVLAGMSALHFMLYKKLSNEKSQFYILGVCICYGLIIILKRMEFGRLIGEFLAQMITFPLTTVTFLLIAGYVSVLFDSPRYRRISHFFYWSVIVIMAAGMLMYLIKRHIGLYYYGLTILSVQYVAASIAWLVLHKNSIDGDTFILLIAVYVMIVSFAVLSLLTVLDVSWAYVCSIGIFVYIITAQIISIKKVLMRLEQLEDNQKESETLTATEEQVYSLMKEKNFETKEIALELKLSVETVRKYQKNIYRKKGVHSKKEL